MQIKRSEEFPSAVIAAADETVMEVK